GGIGPFALIVADRDPEAGRVGRRRRAGRMGDELIAVPVDVAQRSERALAALILGAGINERALAPRKGRLVIVALDQILPDFRPDRLEQPSEIAGNGIIA